MRKTGEGRIAILFLLPALLLLIGILYPFGVAVYYSFTNFRLISPIVKFVGFRNYRLILTAEDFWHSVWVTFIYTFFAVTIEVTLGILVAHLLSRKMKGINLIRLLVFIPMMIPPVVAAIIWKTMMAPEGVLNYILSFLGIENIAWLASSDWALFSVILIDVWLYLPFTTLILLSGLESLPNEPFEAAKVDGANVFQIFRYITLPLLKPFIILSIIFRVIDALKTFDIIYGTTKGGPIDATRVIQLAVYEEGLKWNNMGYALAEIMLLWIFTYIFSQVMLSKFLIKKELKV